MNDAVPSGLAKIVSPASSTPRPAAPALHNATQLPGKCPPSSYRVIVDVTPTLTRPQLDRVTAALQPLGVLGVDQHGRVQDLGPGQLHSEHVRVAGGDRDDRAEATDVVDGLVGDQTGRVPEQGALVGADDQGLLPDAHPGLGGQPDEIRLHLEPLQGVAVGDQRLDGGPALPTLRQVLAFVAADRADPVGSGHPRSRPRRSRTGESSSVRPPLGHGATDRRQLSRPALGWRRCRRRSGPHAPTVGRARRTGAPRPSRCARRRSSRRRHR